MRRRNLIILLVVILLILGGFILVKYSLKVLPGYGGDREPLIGGCAGVHPNSLQECCTRWAAENERVVIQCVGDWIITNNSCSWRCR